MTALVTCLTCREVHAAGDLHRASVPGRAYKCPNCGGHDLDTAELRRFGAPVGDRNETNAAPAAAGEATPARGGAGGRPSELPAAAGALHPALDAAPAVKRGRKRKAGP